MLLIYSAGTQVSSNNEVKFSVRGDGFVAVTGDLTVSGKIRTGTSGG